MANAWPRDCGWSGDFFRFERWVATFVPSGEDFPDPDMVLANIYLDVGSTRRSVRPLPPIDGYDLTPDLAVDRIRDALLTYLSSVSSEYAAITVVARATRDVLVPKKAGGSGKKPVRTPVRKERVEQEEVEEEAEGEDEGAAIDEEGGDGGVYDENEVLPDEDGDPSLDGGDEGDEGEDGEDGGEEDGEGEDGEDGEDGEVGEEAEGEARGGDDEEEMEHQEVPWPEVGEQLVTFSRISAPREPVLPPVSRWAPPGSGMPGAGSPGVGPGGAPGVGSVAPPFQPGQPAGTGVPGYPPPTPQYVPPGGYPQGPGTGVAVPSMPGMGTGMVPAAPSSPYAVPAAPNAGHAGWGYPQGFEFPAGMVPIPSIPVTPELMARPELLYANMQAHMMMLLMGENRFLMHQNAMALNMQGELFRESLRSTRKDRKRAEKAAAREHAERIRILTDVRRTEADQHQQIARLNEARLNEQLTREREFQDRLSGDFAGQASEILSTLRTREAAPPRSPPPGRLDRLKDKFTALAEVAVDEVTRGTVEGLARGKAGAQQPQAQPQAQQPQGLPPNTPGHRWEWVMVRTHDGSPARSLVEVPIGAPPRGQGGGRGPGPQAQPQQAPPQQAPPQQAPPQPTYAPPPVQYQQPQPQPQQQQWVPVQPTPLQQAPAPAAAPPDLAEILSDPSRLAPFMDLMSPEQRTALLDAIALRNPEMALGMAERLMTVVRDA